MIQHDENTPWTCDEFEKALPDLFERAQGGKLSADPRFADILRDCPQAAELVRDLEYIAETADEVGANIQSRVSDGSSGAVN